MTKSARKRMVQFGVFTGLKRRLSGTLIAYDLSSLILSLRVKLKVGLKRVLTWAP